MRVLLVHNSADIYGASRSLTRLCGRLNREKFEPLVLLPENGPLTSLLRAAGAEVAVFPQLRVITRSVLGSLRLLPWMLGFLPSAFRLARLLRKWEIRLVHTNTGVICSSALAARLAGLPHVWHIRDWFQEFGPLWIPYARYILALSSRVICVSRPIAEQFPHSPKIAVVNNGFDLAEFPEISPSERADARAKWGIAEGEFVAATVGRIKFVRKGQEFLLQAAAELSSRGQEVTCLLAGGAAPGAESHVDRMRQFATSVAVKALLVGELRNPRPAYAAADVLVLPSAQPEPFGGVVMEAMALGLPVVGTALGGTCEQVVDGTTGFLVPPSDPQALAESIARLAADPQLRRRMGTEARERVRTRFSLSSMVQQVESLYEESVGRLVPARVRPLDSGITGKQRD